MLFVGLLVAVTYGSSMLVFQGSRQTAEDRHRWNASELATMMMEELSFSFAAEGQLNQGTQVRYYDENYAVVDASRKFYTVEWTVRENNPLQGISHINLVIRWNEGDHEKSVAFQTYR